jgi:hypothetical protein
MNCQMFSWLFSSGERGGIGNSEMFHGTFRSFSVPSGLIKDDDGVGTRADLGGDLVEMKLHGFAVAEGQHQSRAGSELTHGTEQVRRLRTLIVGSPRPRSLSGPAIGDLVLLPTRISSWNHTSTGVSGARRPRISSTRAWKFF